MSVEAILFQALNGLAAAASLFLVGAGLSLIFGVTRIINIAHGSFYMVGLYLAYSFATKLDGALGFWGGIIAAGLIVAALGALVEIVLLRKIAKWLERWASTRRCCSRSCSRSAPSSPASAGRCRWRASRPISDST